MKLRQYGHFAQVILHLAAKDQTPPTPSEVIGWAGEGTLFDKVVERARGVGVDASALTALVLGADRSAFEEQADGWANVTDPQRKYGLSWDGNQGWLALLWWYVDQVNFNAAEAEVR